MKVLFVGPHPDDVEIGALGTLLNLRKNHEIFYITMSRCLDIPRNTDIINEYNKVVKELKVHTEILDLPNRELSQRGKEIREKLENYRDNDIDLVFGPSLSDLHQDHQAVSQEIVRIFRYQSILFYEIPHSCPLFKPRFFFPLEENIVSEKIRIVSLYKSQSKRAYIQEPSLRSMMMFRGLEFDVKYAEGFEVFRLKNLKW